MAKRQTQNIFTDLQGTSSAVIDAVHGITDIVERMHRNIAGLAPVRGDSLPGPTRGITGFVYRRVRGVTRMVGSGLDSAFAQLAKLPTKSWDSAAREAIRGAVNGIFGDYLSETRNPLAITMSLRRGGKEILLNSASLQQMLYAGELGEQGDRGVQGRVLVMVHGLCMNDLQWCRNHHDHGEVLAEATNATVLYLHYNSGRHIFENGRDFAQLLETMVANWPVPLDRLDIVGHSMGGLVTRSAIQFARTAQGGKQAWLARLHAVVFLGTPHQGSPLERAGSGVDSVLSISPYTAPFASLGRARSAGIQDLRHGRIDESGNRSGPVVSKNDAKKSAPRAPTGVKWYAIAASKQAQPSPRASASASVAGDGLVPVASALGVSVAAGHRATFYQTNHFDLLSSRAVCDKIEAWLQAVQ